MKKSILHLLIFPSLIIASSCGKKTEETKPFRKDVTETVFASGILEAEGTYTLTALNEGYLKEIHFKEGDTIQVGKVLAVIENKENDYNAESASELFGFAEKNASPNAPTLVQAKQNIAVAKLNLDQQATQEARYQKLLSQNSVARLDYENVLLSYKTAKANYESAIENYNKLERDAKEKLVSNKASKLINATINNKNTIIALVGGKIYKKFKQTGDYVKKGEALAMIGSPNIIYAKVNIDESNIEKVKIGAPATVVLNASKGRQNQGIVKEILPAFEESSQSFIAKIYFEKPLAFPVVYTQLESNIFVETKQNVLLIPRNYIDYKGFVQVKGSKERKKVETGFSSNEWVEILGGIDENTVLITDNLAASTVKKNESGTKEH